MAKFKKLVTNEEAAEIVNQHFEHIKNKPLKEQTVFGIRLISVCGSYTDKKERSACIRGFVEGVILGLEEGKFNQK